MTNPTVLADALVEAGIIYCAGDNEYYLEPRGQLHSCSTVITDWRVAGKVLEKCGEAHLFWDDVDFGCTLRVGIGIHKGKGSVDGYHRLGLPRAIIEAWYEARQ